MNFIKYTILIIIFFTSSCSYQNIVKEQPEEPKPLILTERMDKQTIKNRFSDLPFGSDKEIKIALLLPLTGKHQKIGKALYDAAQLALFDNGDPRIVIYPFDSKGSEFTAVSAMEDIIEQDIKVIIGPLFSKTVKAITPIAQDNGIIVLSFSNNINVADNNIYITGLDVRQQVQNIASYVFANDIKYFSALLPGNDYGAQIVQELRKIVNINNGVVLKTEFYLPGKKLDPNIKRIITSVSEIPVNTEGEPLFKEIVEGEEIPLDENGQPLYQDISKFKAALLISDSSKKMLQITNLLAKYNFPYDKSKIIGLSLWDNNNALQKNSLSGAWYTDIPKNNLNIYKEHFEQTYDYSAPKISSLAYDMVSVITTLSSIKNINNNIMNEIILNPLGFSGTSGVFRFKKSGVVERLLDIYEVNQGEVNIVSPANFQFKDPEEISIISDEETISLQ